MKRFSALCSVIVLTLCALGIGQTLPSAPQPTNAPQYTVNLSFLGATPYGQSQAVDVGSNFQLTTNNALRADAIVIPGNGYTGALFSDQYSLCAIKPLENVLATTSLSCGTFNPYAVGGAGVGKIGTQNGLAWKASVGANYSFNNVAFNIGEFGYCEFGVKEAGQSHGGLCGQSGLSFLFGTSQAASQAKQARMRHANAKKLAKINAAIKKANQS